ncbi:MAG: sodium-dependent transporter [Firmicutes bacterium]|nr:sodium-dependent transporter [Bacillota bacterium]
MENSKWSSRGTFILAAVGSAVGLGNAWRFPGLCAKYGGGAFLTIYIAAMIIIGIPMLAMEIAAGRAMRGAAPAAMRGLNRKFEPIGWAAVTNAFVVSVYYAVIFAWVILMALSSFKFFGVTGDAKAASEIWSGLIKSTGTTKGYLTVSYPTLACLAIAWGLIYFCVRNGAASVGKVVKYTVFLPMICLVIMAVKGVTMPGSAEGLRKLFIPDASFFADADLWIAAVGQVFYSLSIMMAVMFAYGSYLDSGSNIAADAVIITLSDLAVSLLSGIVLFTTMYGTGLSVDNMSASGIGTAFVIYPSVIATLTSSGAFNAVFAFVFYFCLCTLAIDSAFSVIEGVAAAIAERFNKPLKQMTRRVCAVSGALSLIFTTGAGLALVDITDYWCNSYNLIIVGILETAAIGWFYKTDKLLGEINMNTRKFRIPKWWFYAAIKAAAPVTLIGFLIWNVVSLFKGGGIYGEGYSPASNIIFGWLVTAMVFASGFILKRKNLNEIK